MADCSYARCVQERRFIRRELQRWTKNMVHIVGLERVAEEFMGRRKWKLCQEVLARSQNHFQETSTPTINCTPKDNSSSNNNNNHTSTTTSTITTATTLTATSPTNSQATEHLEPLGPLSIIAHHISENGGQVFGKVSDQLTTELLAKVQGVKEDDQEETTTTTTTIKRHIDGNHIDDASDLLTGSYNSVPLTCAKVATTASTFCVKTDPEAAALSIDENQTNHNLVHSYSSGTKVESKEVEADGDKCVADGDGDDCTELLPHPVDWKPQDKCNFCVNGKLYTVNERGELVAETGPVVTQSEQELVAHRTSLESDTDSSDSSDNEQPIHNIPPAVNSQADFLRATQNMTAFGSVAQMELASSLASINLPQQMGNLYKNFYYQQILRQMNQHQPQETTVEPSQLSTNSPTAKSSPSPNEVNSSFEQPLDLSAKNATPSTSASAIPSLYSAYQNDPKRVYTAKPRMSTVAGRRTYTEEELQSALQDILSGKLGTRRAAVQYGIPRSTLRNKVYKLGMEQKREASLQQTIDDPLEDEDKEMSGGEDDKDSRHGRSPVPINNIMTQKHQEEYLRLLGNASMPSSVSALQAMQKFSKYADHGKSLNSSSVQEQSVPQPQPNIPPLDGNPWLDQNNMLMLIQDPTLQEIIRNYMLQQGYNNNQQLKNISQQSGSSGIGGSSQHSLETALNNGKSSGSDLRHLPYAKQQSSTPSSTASSSVSAASSQLQQHLRSRLPIKCETSLSAEHGSTGIHDHSSEHHLSSEDAAVILRIPSVKPTMAGGSSTSSTPVSGKNGDGICTPPLQASTMVSTPTPPIISPSPQNHMPGISPPLLRHNNDSDSQTLTVNDIIGGSLNRTFHQQQQHQQQQQRHTPHITPQVHHGHQSHHHRDAHNANDVYRPSISVIKNLGGTDISCFGGNPNLLAGVNSLGNNSSSHQHQAAAAAAAAAAGKGTRPKRGKYRNYDRDSLVEAVKAVQRGEMSVHRAGSYYGVPHSTLEYKVKERHLMRPRKREPKLQPLDERASTSSSMAPKSSQDLRSFDKQTKSMATGIKGPSMKSVTPGSAGASGPSPFQASPTATTSPNGLKMPFMDPQLGYNPHHLFWPQPAGFGGMNLDFGRVAAAAAAANSPGGAAAFAGNADTFFASHALMQQFQDLQANAKTQNANNNNSHNMKLFDALYDGPSANILLDGIIRSSLDRKSGDHSGTLLHLIKSGRSPAVASSRRIDDNTSDNVRTASGSNKRPGSPLNLSDIKKERSSPMEPSNVDDRIDDLSLPKDNAESILKLRDEIALQIGEKVAAHNLRSSTEGQNGGGPIPLQDEADIKPFHHHHLHHHDNDDSS